MPDSQLQPAMSQLFRDTAQAHHVAFAATDGADPDWPIWYADYLQQPLRQALDMEFYKSQLIYCLMNADFEYVARSLDTDWPDFYAAEFVEHYAASETANEDRLALYYVATCPYCQRVMKAIARLGLDVEMRDVIADGRWRDELVEVRGRATVPVLWIQSPDHNVRWMPESRDIMQYLEKTYGQENVH